MAIRVTSRGNVRTKVLISPDGLTISIENCNFPEGWLVISIPNTDLQRILFEQMDLEIQETSGCKMLPQETDVPTLHECGRQITLESIDS